VIPRKIAFYYYYYPAGMMLSFALGYVFYSSEPGPIQKWIREMPWTRWAYLGAACGMFIYFFPILAALKIPLQSFRQWMWFVSWI
jgi:dolichyl-phosphate-mannose--protein O-mannosyl transferase